MFSTFFKWLDFVKFSHTIFALPFALAAMALAARETRGWPGGRTFLLILAAMVCARTCAMAFNRIVDRKYDALNPRTAKRHLPAGTISLVSAVTLCALSAAGLLAAAWFLNPLCFKLAPVALFFVCFYSLTKRFTDWTHVWLGIALALAPIGAWLAVRGEFGFAADDSPFGISRIGRLVHDYGLVGVQPILLAVIVVFWLFGFDIIYAIQDFEFDRRQGLRSLVVAWGPANALKISLIAHLIMWGLLAVFGLLAGFKLAYYVAIALILPSLILEHWLARRRNMNWVQNAFFRLNAFVSVVFLTGVLIEVVFPGFRIVR